jgi:hypothetical protein
MNPQADTRRWHFLALTLAISVLGVLTGTTTARAQTCASAQEGYNAVWPVKLKSRSRMRQRSVLRLDLRSCELADQYNGGHACAPLAEGRLECVGAGVDAGLLASIWIAELLILL